MDKFGAGDWLERLASLNLAMLSAEHQCRAWHKPLMLLVALHEMNARRLRLQAMTFYTHRVGSLLEQFQTVSAQTWNDRRCCTSRGTADITSRGFPLNRH